MILSKTICEELAGSLYKAEAYESGMAESISCMTSLCALMGAEQSTKKGLNSARSVEKINLISPKSGSLLIDPPSDLVAIKEEQ